MTELVLTLMTAADIAAWTKYNISLRFSEGAPPRTMSIKLPDTLDKNVKERESEDDSELRFEDFLREKNFRPSTFLPGEIRLLSRTTRNAHDNWAVDLLVSFLNGKYLI